MNLENNRPWNLESLYSVPYTLLICAGTSKKLNTVISDLTDIKQGAHRPRI